MLVEEVKVEEEGEAGVVVVVRVGERGNKALVAERCGEGECGGVGSGGDCDDGGGEVVVCVGGSGAMETMF